MCEIEGREVRIIVGANIAKAEPPLGPMLGQHGLNSREVVKELNVLTSKYVDGLRVRVKVHVGKNREFKLSLIGICAYELITEVIGDSGYIFQTELSSIAKLQSNELGVGVFALYKSLCSTVSSMGYKIYDEKYQDISR